MKHLLLSVLAIGLPFLHGAPIEAGRAVQVMAVGVPPGEQARLNGTYPVSEAGFIRMWSIGNIQAAGLDPAALAERIERAYIDAGIYTDPVFQVVSDSSDSIVTQMITVGGKVGGPGPKPYQKGMTLFQAIASAGGPTEFGALNRVKLYRNQKVYTYDLTQGDSKMLLIYPNDIIDVPEKNWLGK